MTIDKLTDGLATALVLLNHIRTTGMSPVIEIEIDELFAEFRPEYNENPVMEDNSIFDVNKELTKNFGI